MDLNEKALALHKQWNGKLSTEAKSPVKSREDLSIAYTPGVAEPCKVIAKDPAAAYGFSTLLNQKNAYRPQKCGIFLSNSS